MRLRAVTDQFAVVSQDEQRFASVRHSHAEAQLIYAISGVVAVTTDRGTWVVPPNRAVWVPAGVEHMTMSPAAVQFRALLIGAAHAKGLPDACRVVAVTPLLRELIVRLAALADQPGQGAPASGPDAGALVQAVTRLLLLELAFLPIEPLALPMPRHGELARFCQRVRSDPAGDVSIAEAAAALRMSRSSFMRLFRRETGMSFGRWRQQTRILQALTLLAGGKSILHVALDCGYDSPSAFAAMFRRSLGRPPSAYVSG